VESVAAKTATRVNRLAPVDRLSDDNLVHILLQLDSRTTFFATKVSRRWRNLALSTPSLWAHIDLSCRSDFRPRFQLFLDRSQNAPLDLKLVMESTKVDTSHVDKDDRFVLWGLLCKQCVDDVREQLGFHIKRLVLDPDVLARLRTLDITSMLWTASLEDGYDEIIRQPTPTLRLPAAPSLQRLRLNWAEPDVHELHLVLDPEIGAFDSVSFLALCAIDNLEEVLPLFPRVVDLSLWVVEPPDSTTEDIQLADICEWMPQLRRLEVAEVPVSFASKAPVVPPSLHRLLLHGLYSTDVLNDIASIMDLNSISEISLWKHTCDDLKPSIISAFSGPTVELSVYSSPRSSRGNWSYNFCAEDGRGLRRILHSRYSYYKPRSYDEIVSYATISTTVEAFHDVFPAVMPQLVTLRIRMGGLQSDSHRVSQVSCSALAQLELYFTAGSGDEKVMSGTEVASWITGHLKDFDQPLEMLRVVGVRLGSDVGALDSLSRTVLFTPSSLFEYVTRSCRRPHSPYSTGNGPGRIHRYLLSFSTGRRLGPQRSAPSSRASEFSNSSVIHHTKELLLPANFKITVFHPTDRIKLLINRYSLTWQGLLRSHSSAMIWHVFLLDSCCRDAPTTIWALLGC